MKHWPNNRQWGCAWKTVWFWQVPFLLHRGWVISVHNRGTVRIEMAFVAGGRMFA